ncbi:DUF4834 family protein [Dysgonomonas massiliensis]|uniref:DUF4834 family protein n=1 Tax=Dysgonomonas massiliensis TaxID=2040292 RepID=UPI000C770F18|nr:DUF4834 family protein [Dysgonomonas massiliensis]
MKFILFFFLIIIFFVVVLVLSFIGKVANLFRGSNQRHQARQQQYEEEQKSASGTKKFISEDEGQYVDFEEIKEDK